MRSNLLDITLLLLHAGLVAAGKKVPGDNPLSLCSRNPAEDILQIEELNLSPNPVPRNGTLVFKARGRVTQAIEKGALVEVEAWEGNESVLDETFDLCDDLEWISDEECTPKEGVFSVSKKIVIEDDDLPDGAFSMRVDVKTAGGQQITCLTGEFKSSE
ncbi:Phosphatidylglycerol/phosphatidylinositol transfer protein [Diaporthe australafricana]|uniref:Phosphatidylglycerol/phosphatidylinositol transfer protein n=1 Tax=Diaporthe australafricana TaxID=127596 RepID=A0ABR3X669_9PEZI